MNDIRADMDAITKKMWRENNRRGSLRYDAMRYLIELAETALRAYKAVDAQDHDGIVKEFDAIARLHDSLGLEKDYNRGASKYRQDAKRRAIAMACADQIQPLEPDEDA